RLFYPTCRSRQRFDEASLHEHDVREALLDRACEVVGRGDGEIDRAEQPARVEVDAHLAVEGRRRELERVEGDEDRRPERELVREWRFLVRPLEGGLTKDEHRAAVAAGRRM